MSLFDFPRINFNGDIDINVSTINNSVYFPLTLYDQMYSRPLFPPRLYFTNNEIITSVQPSINPKIYTDSVNGYVYIEIEPVNTIAELRTWCITPLGNLNIDADYIPYYKAAQLDLGINGFQLIGNVMGYWNMFGDFGVTVSNTTVTGVQTCDGNSVTTWSETSDAIPLDVAPFLGASFDLNTAPASGRTTALMVETISSQSVYANIYCSNINLFNRENIYLQGNPIRFSAQLYSAWRVLNWMPPMAGSARFCTCIPFDGNEDIMSSDVVNFFKNNSGYDGRNLKGVFITLTLLEVFENRFDQNIYLKMDNPEVTPNPAQASVSGSITPWYDNDMKTGVIGRNLIPLYQKYWYNNGGDIGIPVAPVPAIASMKDLQNGSLLFSIDMGNTMPEQITNNPGITQPVFRGQATFETFNLGNLSFRYGTDKSTEICNIAVNPTDNPRVKIFQMGGVFDYIISDATLIQNIKDNYILVFLEVAGNADVQVLKESTYMIASDQKGLYSNEGDTPSQGYLVNSGVTREQCNLRIYNKGLPATSNVDLYIAEYVVPEAANDPATTPLPLVPFSAKDGDVVNLSAPASPLTMKNNAIYYFVYDNEYNNNTLPAFVVQNYYTIMDSGSFVVLRVHPKLDYTLFGPPANPPTFNDVYNYVFQLYDVVYPIMASIHPFTEEVWNNGTMAGLVLQRVQLSYWNNIQYMPRSRELSASQLELLTAWANTFN
ncbi:MAG: hypothetical protein SGJ10_02405 [Bacteroidota bacterium]|nr:hypothetical protein [Bacteroidota bacterium]